MDHFLLPKGKRHLQVPNLTLEDYSLGPGGFESYPTRNGYPTESSSRPEEIVEFFSRNLKSSKKVASLFQNWLFFGFAIEVFAIADIEVKQSDLLDETRRYISTRRLPQFIRQWRSKIEALGGKQNSSHIAWAMKTGSIVKQVSDFVDTYCLPFHGARRAAAPSADTASPISELTWISIISMGHTIFEAMTTYFKIVRTANKWGASRLLKQRLLKNGWCPMDVERSMTDLGIDGHYYLARMNRPDPDVSHTDCTKNECIAHNVDKDTYEQKHTPECSGCNGPMKVDVSVIENAINTYGRVPVVRWDQRKKQLEVKSSYMIKRGSSHPPFIAISHVWSDGMGNRTENSLVECQLNRIQNLVNTLARSPKVKGDPQHFWLDTLCIPVGAEKGDAKALAIQKMANTYKAASAVLVLSSSIESVATTDSDAAKGLALYFANWNRRLWTIQEGMFAKAIMLKFADRVISNEEITYNESRDSVFHGHCVTFPSSAGGSAMSHFVVLRDFLRDGLFAQMSPIRARDGPLAATIDLLQTRSTSWRSDETSCFGTLIGLNLKRLQAIKRESCVEKGTSLSENKHASDSELAKRRMKLFLTMVKVFPRDMIFNSHRRLDYDGFRWAPESFLGIPRQGFVRTVEGQPAVLDQKGRGLLVNGDGITFEADDSASQQSSESLIITIPFSSKHKLELKITVLQLSDHSVPFSWIPGREYGVILDKPVTRDVQDISNRWQKEITPTTPPELELWFESQFLDSRGGANIVDAAVGQIRDREDNKDDNSKNWIQIQHECIANVTLLNPECLSPDDDSSSEWEDEEGEEEGENSPDSLDENSDKEFDMEEFAAVEYFGDSADAQYLDLYATEDFANDDIPADDEQESQPEDSGEELATEYNDNDWQSDPGDGLSGQLDPLSDWGSLLGDGDRSDDDHVFVETSVALHSATPAVYINSGRWFIV